MHAPNSHPRRQRVKGSASDVQAIARREEDYFRGLKRDVDLRYLEWETRRRAEGTFTIAAPTAEYGHQHGYTAKEDE